MLEKQFNVTSEAKQIVRLKKNLNLFLGGLLQKVEKKIRNPTSTQNVVSIMDLGKQEKSMEHKKLIKSTPKTFLNQSLLPLKNSPEDYQEEPKERKNGFNSENEMGDRNNEIFYLKEKVRLLDQKVKLYESKFKTLENLHSQMAVSYTHLTLPTICSV